MRIHGGDQYGHLGPGTRRLGKSSHGVNTSRDFWKAAELPCDACLRSVFAQLADYLRACTTACEDVGGITHLQVATPQATSGTLTRRTRTPAYLTDCGCLIPGMISDHD